jgi:hypothetical protein
VSLHNDQPQTRCCSHTALNQVFCLSGSQCSRNLTPGGWRYYLLRNVGKQRVEHRGTVTTSGVGRRTNTAVRTSKWNVLPSTREFLKCFAPITKNHRVKDTSRQSNDFYTDKLNISRTYQNVLNRYLLNCVLTNWFIYFSYVYLFIYQLRSTFWNVYNKLTNF